MADGSTAHADTSVADARPLAEWLRLRREEEEEAHQRRLQAMHQGAVRPLDVDEAAFLSTWEDERRRARRLAQQQEQQELRSYRMERVQAPPSPPRASTLVSARAAVPTHERRRRHVAVQAVQVRPKSRVESHAPSLVQYPSSEEEEEEEGEDEQQERIDVVRLHHPPSDGNQVG